MTSSQIILRIRIGSKIEPPGSPAKLPPFNILLFAITYDNRVVNIFTNSFLKFSNKIIGRVFDMSQFHLVSLGMGLFPFGWSLI